MPALEITTIIGCKNMCVYCPQKILIKNYKGDKKMSYETFIKILNNVPKKVRIDFTGFSEAFLNKDSSTMMKYSLDNRYVVQMCTTLTGFNNNDLDILSKCENPFDSVGFHKFIGKNYDENVFNEKVQLFKSNIKCKRYSPGNGEFMNSWSSRAGCLWDDEKITGEIYCDSTQNFDYNIVMPNGDVYLCCMDYGLKHKIGNLIETDFYSLNREEIIELSKKKESDLICRKCEGCHKKDGEKITLKRQTIKNGNLIDYYETR